VDDAKRFFVIVNPESGHRRGLQVLEQVRPIFEAADAKLDVKLCERPRHAFQLASEIDAEKYQACCVIGGDGTIHEVVNGLMMRGIATGLPLGLIPAGTGNTLHFHQHAADNPVEAAKRILSGRTGPLDVARVTMGDEIEYCVNIVGWAAVADINIWAERLRWCGPARYALATLRYITNPRARRAKLILDDRVIEDEFQMVIGCNTKYTGKGMMLAPRAEINDDLIDVVVVRHASRWEMLRLFQRVFDGSHVEMKCVECHQARRFAIELDDQRPLNLDGEATGSAPFAVEMLPGAMRIIN
jgi:YegS/Rv2252/BmrU family lipid kinase